VPPIVEPGAPLTVTVVQTKYRVPRPRRDAIRRDALLARLRVAATTLPVTVVVAPSGYGKTTLLAQLARALDGQVRVTWIVMDPDDDDPNRFVAHLVRAVEPLDLKFLEDPEALIASVTNAGRQARAAIGALVNALCTSSDDRIVLIFDDLHRVARPEIGTLLEALIERLPDHVSIVLGGRDLPPVPLARWIVLGEAARFGPEHLQFGVAEAAALSDAFAIRTADEELERLVRRVHGWPAGIAMLLRARGANAEAIATRADSALYDYLAEEVLFHLPAELQRFAVDSAVLQELRPELCEAVTGRPDSRMLLRSLYEHELFVIALDATTPVLRFHDLFRDFLLHRLDGDPKRLREMHMRAARAERDLGRAIGHHLEAEDWDGALLRLVDGTDALLAEGGHVSIERWLERIPESGRARDWRWHYLRGLCAWRAGDWLRARNELSFALDRSDGSMPQTLRARALLYRMGALNGLGERDAAVAVAVQIDPLPLNGRERAAFGVQRAWSALALGDHARAVSELREASTLALGDPEGVAVPLAEFLNTSYVGLPGAHLAYRDLLTAWDAARGSALAPWHAAPAILAGWLNLWTGDASKAAMEIERSQELARTFGVRDAVEDALQRLEAMYAALTGRGDETVRIWSELLAKFELPRLGSVRASFESIYVHGFARAAWVADERAAFRALVPRAVRAPRPEEFTVIGTAGLTIAGQVALLDGDWRGAAAAFEKALPLHRHARLPQVHADPRAGLAYAYLKQGRRADSLAAFEPLLVQCVVEDAVGPLLWEPEWLARALLDALAPAQREPMLARLDAWYSLQKDGRRARLQTSTGEGRADGDDAVGTRDPVWRGGRLGVLTEREYEVLSHVAGGASNKEVARALDLSLHTVKRHIANLLGKLDCVSRRQAADLWRQERTRR
jgi:LuxR family maltose regulon positive regulatory protein